MPRTTPLLAGLAILVAATFTVTLRAQAVVARAGVTTTARTVRRAEVQRELSALADDSMQGRRTGTPGAARAARYIAQQMQAIGLTPAGDSGYFQKVPVALVMSDSGRQHLVLADSSGALPAGGERLPSVNVVGILRGADPVLGDSVVLVDAHYDHLGIGPAVNGDSIYNGADDDASGTVAVLEIARALAAGPRPKRTVVFLATTGEEVGLLGTRWFIAHPVVPLDHIEANLEIEMIGRPDTAAGGPGRGWLTGFERSTMGEMFARAGLPIGPDRRPEQQFFLRSDNIAFARRGIPAHTLSSFDLHADYHAPSDEVSRIDFDHMTRLIDAAAKGVRILADGPAPEWKPGGRPAATRARRSAAGPDRHR
jgi:Zn-dependent M28 family amino/carboxypeptidase